MSERPKWAQHLAFFVADEIIDERFGYPMDGSDDGVLDEIEAAVLAILCKHYGHETVNDQCGIPEHRYCVHCQRRESVLAAEVTP